MGYASSRISYGVHTHSYSSYPHHTAHPHTHPQHSHTHTHTVTRSPAHASLEHLSLCCVIFATFLMACGDILALESDRVAAVPDTMCLSLRSLSLSLCCAAGLLRAHAKLFREVSRNVCIGVAFVLLLSLCRCNNFAAQSHACHAPPPQPSLLTPQRLYAGGRW